LTASSPGWSLAFRAAAGIIVIVVLGLTPLRARIWAEERLLIQTFGAEYVTYLERAWRLALHLG
jgi:protein-S-isoprenylcysteine O-methyltransferase Ste14